MEFKERKHGFRLSELAFKLSGKKAIVETETIKGKKLNLIFTFPNKSSYHAEFRDWVEFQDKVFKERESSQQAEGFKIYSAIKEKKEISYDEFIKTAVPFFSRVMFHVFNDNPDLFMDQEETTVQIKVARAERWEYDEAEKNFSFSGGFPFSDPESFVNKYLKEGIMDIEHFYVQFSVFYILQSIVAPHIFLKRIDYSFLYNYLSHEFEHYKQLAEGFYTDVYALKHGISKHMAKKSDHSLVYLYMCISDLRNEGLADFRRKSNTQKIPVNIKWIRNFRNLVKKIPEIKNKKELDDYYESSIYAGSMEGVYYCGYIMCFFIAYSLDPQSCRIMLGSKFFEDASHLPEMFKKGENFYLAPPSEKSRREAFALISKMTPFEFIEAYEKACKKLGLDQDSMTITPKFFKKLWNEAEYIFQHDELEKIKKAGFYPRI